MFCGYFREFHFLSSLVSTADFQQLVEYKKQRCVLKNHLINIV